MAVDKQLAGVAKVMDKPAKSMRKTDKALKSKIRTPDSSSETGSQRPSQTPLMPVIKTETCQTLLK
jgi:hypothetical protein